MNSYWLERQEQWIRNQDKDDERLARKLEGYYKQTANNLEKDIAQYFQLYGENNVIEFRELMKNLSKRDKDLLYRDIDSFVEKYPEYKNLVPVRTSVYKLNRLEGLHYSTQLKLLELGVIEQREFEKHLTQTYKNNYETLIKELGLGAQFLSVNDSIIKKVLNTNWINERNFSNSIWQNKGRLLEHLKTTYRDGIVRGDNYDKMTQNLLERFNVAYNDAKRLVWTESSFVLNQAHIQPYIDLGYEEYELNAILDSKTSDICRDIHEQVFRFDEIRVGVNFPPFHPWCRTTFVAAEVIEQDQLLPSYSSAEIPEEKLTKYALDLDGAAPDKAIAFEKALGYNKNNYSDLIENIKGNLRNFEAEPRGNKGYGETYQVIMYLTGPNGKSANVLTGWIVDTETGKTRLTTIYVARKDI